MAKRARRCARVAELHNAEGGGLGGGLGITMGWLSPQFVADSVGMRQGGMRQPWPDARVAIWPESHRRGNRSEQRKGTGLGGYRVP
jgi:hypothetical protein